MRNGHTGAGFLDHTRELLAAGMDYFQARAQLAGIESKEALLQYGVAIGLLVAAFVFAIFAYAFLCIGVVVLVAYLLKISAGWTLLALALLHVAFAAVAVLIARTKLTQPVFGATLREFKKDQQWLSTTPSKN